VCQPARTYVWVLTFHDLSRSFQRASKRPESAQIDKRNNRRREIEGLDLIRGERKREIGRAGRGCRAGGKMPSTRVERRRWDEGCLLCGGGRDGRTGRGMRQGRDDGRVRRGGRPCGTGVRGGFFRYALVRARARALPPPPSSPPTSLAASHSIACPRTRPARELLSHPSSPSRGTCTVLRGGGGREGGCKHCHYRAGYPRRARLGIGITPRHQRERERERERERSTDRRNLIPYSRRPAMIYHRASHHRAHSCEMAWQRDRRSSLRLHSRPFVEGDAGLKSSAGAAGMTCTMRAHTDALA